MEVKISNKRTSVVAAGSVWETRMKNDEVKGGIKVFKAQQQQQKPEQVVGNGSSRLRRTSIGSSKRKLPEKQCSSDGIKKSPIQNRKIGEKFERIPIQSRKIRSESDDTITNSIELRKIKSDPMNSESESGTDSIELRKSTNSELDPVQENEVDELDDGFEKIEVENDENCEDFDVCEDKEILSIQNSAELLVPVGGDDSESESEEDDVIDDDEIIPEKNNNIVVNEQEKKVAVNESEKKIVVNQQENKKVVNEAEPKKVVNAHMRFYHRNERKPVSVPMVVKQSPSPTIKRRNSTIYQNSNLNSAPQKKEEHNHFPQTQKLQSLVDLIMWSDVSRSAFVFGFGTFIIVSSSYARDINLSLISAMSYVGLVYLALIFLYRSLICRGVIDVNDSNYVLGEKDAIWMLKFILPYLNEFLSKLKALFSGDPGNTMKLAVLLFVLARCGSFITVWKMAKFGFFGVFIVPKICSLYSAQLTAYANFWILRFRDAWDSCTHKKAVALGIFGLVWNLSSVVARIWAVFMLFVAFRYYQQHYIVRDECVEDETECDETWEEPVRQKQPNLVATNKVKKGL